MQSRRLATASSSSVVTRTVEVPVIRERLVTQVVYRERARRPLQAGNRAEEKQNIAKASTPRDAAIENSPPSLAGFKPANEARLTIIKGSERNDK